MKPVCFPEEIREALEVHHADLAVSISGGKDSHAMLLALLDLYRERGWKGQFYAVHAHLGRMEWQDTLPFIQTLCASLDAPLRVVERKQGDLLQEMQDRMEKLRGQGKPHFPDARNRYCTSDNKRNPIDTLLRAAPFPDAKNRYCTSHHKTTPIDSLLRKSPHYIISAEGVRADESYARAKKPEWERRKQICTRTRVGLTWRPLLHWSEADIWERIGHTLDDLNHRRMLYRLGWEDEAFDGWEAHPAYVRGNSRLSCAICVLGSRADIENGAKHNRELWAELVKMEEESGFSWRKDLALKDLEI